jgi:hypothetical protein
MEGMRKITKGFSQEIRSPSRDLSSDLLITKQGSILVNLIIHARQQRSLQIKLEYLGIGVGEVRVVAGRADKCGGECSTGKILL